MKNYFLGLVFFFLMTPAISQIDAIKIASAKKAYENGDYKIALSSLSEVSQASRENKVFLFHKGMSHYNLNEYDSAEVYLKKFLIKDINNEKVTDALVDIDYKRKKMIEQQKINEEKRNLNGEWESSAVGRNVTIYQYGNEFTLKNFYINSNIVFKYDPSSSETTKNTMVFFSTPQQSTIELIKEEWPNRTHLYFEDSKKCKINYTLYSSSNEKHSFKAIYYINEQKFDIYEPKIKCKGSNYYNDCHDEVTCRSCFFNIEMSHSTLLRK